MLITEIGQCTCMLVDLDFWVIVSGPIKYVPADIAHVLGIDNFGANSGWLRNFKSRHGIRELKMNGEKLSADNENAVKFTATLNDLNTKKGYCVTHLCCANATCSDGLPLLLVGIVQDSRLVQMQKLQYDETFNPHFEEYQQKTKRSGKVLLIIDDAPCHSSSELLDCKNSLFKVLFLPPNTLSLVQPICQTVIQSLKKRYRKQFLRKIVLSEADESDLVSQLKIISLKDCCYMIVQAYDCSISGHTLRVSWNKLLGYNEEFSSQSTDCVEDFAAVTEMFEKFKLSQDESEQWLADDDTPSFEALTDDGILKVVEKDENEDVDESDMSFIAKFLFNWMEQQNKFNATQLMVVRHICDITAQKKLSSLK
ncbi:Jerky -like protein-like [Trichinella pseudospiralis]|uniref:Jerky-like protein-like n=1 Tax=Trichinella pseudospiralis TaxID=6337 RepID=A0A0V1F995_TRIPS|nr:Jerky -like protein-like [Trichinella pseudospiralis]